VVENLDLLLLTIDEVLDGGVLLEDDSNMVGIVCVCGCTWMCVTVRGIVCDCVWMWMCVLDGGVLLEDDAHMVGVV
jgi:hypothetical protein